MGVEVMTVIDFIEKLQEVAPGKPLLFSLCANEYTGEPGSRPPDPTLYFTPVALSIKAGRGESEEDAIRRTPYVLAWITPVANKNP